MFTSIFGGKEKSSSAAPGPFKSVIDLSNREVPTCDLCLQDRIRPVRNGLKGIPRDVSFVHYHVRTALLVIGTSRGSVIVYGQGFQMECDLVPVLEAYGATEEAERGAESVYSGKPYLVTGIHTLGSEWLLVSLRCGALLQIDILSLEVITCLPARDLRAYSGVAGPKGSPARLSAVHTDEAGGKPYAYVGMSTGDLLIFEATKPNLRVVDFRVNTGVSSGAPITAIALCPHDERYLAIAFDRPPPSGTGTPRPLPCVVLHDMRSNKPQRRYTMVSPVVSMVWEHLGAYVMVALQHTASDSAARAADAVKGTVYTGKDDIIGTSDCIVVLELNKQYAALAWTTAGSVADSSDGSLEGSVGIADLQWLAPQTEGDPGAGCLLVLLRGYNHLLESIDGEYGLRTSCRADVNTYSLQRDAAIVLKFAANDGRCAPSLSDLLPIPQVPQEQTIAAIPIPLISASTTPTIAFVLVTQDVPEHSAQGVDKALGYAENLFVKGKAETNLDMDKVSPMKNLRLQACPASVMSSWSLEVGMLPHPRHLTEVLMSPPGALNGVGFSVLSKSRVTAMDAFTVSRTRMFEQPGTLSAALAVHTQRAASPFKNNAAKANHPQENRLHLCEPVLAGSSRDAQDLFVTGYECGTLCVWAAAYPHLQSNVTASVWRNAFIIHGKGAGQGTSTNTTDSPTSANDSTGSSKTSRKTQVTCITRDDTRGLIAWSDGAGRINVWGVWPGVVLREVFAGTIGKNQNVTCLLLVPSSASESAARLVVGTQEGRLYYTESLERSVASMPHFSSDSGEGDSDGLSPLQQLFGLAQVRPVGAVAHLWYGVRVSTASQGSHFPVLEPALYVILASGQCAVIQICAGETAPLLLAAYSSNPLENSSGATRSPASRQTQGLGAQAFTSESTEAQWERSNEVGSANICAIGLYSAAGSMPSEREPPLVFVVVFGRCIVAYDLRTFTLVDTKSTAYSSDATVSASRIVKYRISHARIISATALLLPRDVCKCGKFIDLEGRQRATNIHILFANSRGNAGVISLASIFSVLANAHANDAKSGSTNAGPGVGALTPSSLIDILPGEQGDKVRDVSSPVVLTSAIATMTGNLYLRAQSGRQVSQITLLGSNFAFEVDDDENNGGTSVFNAAVANEAPRKPGARCNASAYTITLGFLSSPTTIARQLLTGREARVVKLAKKVEKRRASIMPFSILSASPTDLEELYRKTRMAGNAAEFEVEEESESSKDSKQFSKAATNAARSGATDAASAMREAKQNLEKRGEMLTVMAAKSEVVAADSDDFRKTAKEQRIQLEAKKNRWGF